MDGMGYEVGISRTVERKVTFITLIFLRNPNSLPETNIVRENWWLEDDISFWDGLLSDTH